MSENPRKFTLGRKAFTRNNPRPEDELRPPIDSIEILRQNQKARSPTEQPVNLAPPQSRRRRDYWTILIAGNAAIATMVAVMHKNVAVLVFGLSGAVVFSIGVTWVIWVVMDDH